MRHVLIFAYLIHPTVLGSQSTIKTRCLQLAIFSFSEKLIVRTFLKQDFRKLLLAKKIFGKKLQTALVLFISQTTCCKKLRENKQFKFTLTCSSQKGPKRWFTQSHLEILKKFNNLFYWVFQNFLPVSCDSQLYQL